MAEQGANLDDVRARFSATAELVAQHAEKQIELVREQLRSFVAPAGDERAIDTGTGAGTLALALAPLVGEVVGVDVVPELLERARAAAAANVTFLEGDATSLPFEAGSFDLSCSRRTLHHIARPELAVAELTRVTAPGGRVFVDDQIAPVDPLAALELDRFERARDPSHTRTLPDIDLRHLFEANGLVLLRTQFQTHRRVLDSYLDLAGCQGEAREVAGQLSPGGERLVSAEAARLGRPSQDARYPDRPATRASSPGTSACAIAKARYQRGTKISRRSRSIVLTTWRATCSGSITRRRKIGLRNFVACGKPSVSTKPGLTVWTWIPRARSSAAVERENASCACFAAEYGPAGANATVPATETMFTTSARPAASSAGRNARRHQTAPR